MATFPNLRQLRLSHIPLFTGKGASEVRPLVIGRIANLAVFNASIIGPRERRDAEKSYMRDLFRSIKQYNASLNTTHAVTTTTESLYTAHETSSIASSSNSSSNSVAPLHILELNPRFEELCAMYAADLQSLQGVASADSGSIAADLLTIGLHFMSISSITTSSDGQPIQKRLPASLTISKLRTVVKQLFGLDPHLQQLSIRLYKDAVPTVLDDDEATLAYYGADNGSDVFINEAKKQ